MLSSVKAFVGPLKLSLLPDMVCDDRLPRQHSISVCLEIAWFPVETAVSHFKLDMLRKNSAKIVPACCLKHQQAHYCA